VDRLGEPAREAARTDRERAFLDQLGGARTDDLCADEDSTADSADHRSTSGD